MKLFQKVPEEKRRKLLMNVFLYYPLALLVSVAIAEVILEFVGINLPLPLLLFGICVLILVGIINLHKIYKSLLAEESSEACNQ
jgi:small neutral amino acid transporter SnatA (MarC family)